jgi:ATP-dependent exoDNAse (exonuclease V) alpha subunit
MGLTEDEIQDIIHYFGIESIINRFFKQPYYFYTLSTRRLVDICKFNNITVEPVLYKYHDIANRVYYQYLNGGTSLPYPNIDEDTMDRLRDIYNIRYDMGCLYLEVSLLMECHVAQWLRMNPVDIIVGRAGTGKTTRIKSMVKPDDTLLLTYTGKAASRLKEVTGYPSSTIHRLLSNDNRVNIKRIVIDEASMLPTDLFYSLILRYPRFHLTLVGDEDQLPPISGGCFLIQLLKSGKFPVTRLTEILRTDRRGIIDNIDRYMRGDTLISNEDFHIVNSLESVIDFWVASKIDVTKTVVITPYVKDQQWINSMVRTKFHPNATLVTEGIYINDRVTVKNNDYKNEVMHGDEGLVVGFDHKNRKVMVRFNGKDVMIQPSELLVTFALTIHTSQGSEWDYVAIYIPPDCSMDFLDDRMIYTAITRSRYKVWIVGNVPRRWRRPDPHDNLSVRISKYIV